MCFVGLKWEGCVAEYTHLVGVVLLGMPCGLDGARTCHHAVWRWECRDGEGVFEGDVRHEHGQAWPCGGHAGGVRCALCWGVCDWDQVFKFPAAVSGVG
jgi:hypothetical protein